jgi:hypothetical protein
MGSSESDMALVGDVATIAGLAAGILGAIGTVAGLIGYFNAGGPTSS